MGSSGGSYVCCVGVVCGLVCYVYPDIMPLNGLMFLLRGIMAKAPQKRKFVDWDSIEPLYRAGNLSLNDICRQYAADHAHSQVWKTEVKHNTISEYAKKKKWSKNLANKVKERIQEKLTTGLTTACRQAGKGGSDEDIIERASDTGANIVLRHRDEIFELQKHERRLLKELSETPKKLYLANFQGKIIEKEYAVTLNENSVTLKNLAAVRAQRIALERVAHNLDDDSSKGPQDIFVTVAGDE